MSQSLWGDSQTEFFYNLTPETTLNAVERLGYQVTGRVLTLNSMENRVYEIEIINEDSQSPSDNFVIAKFYRPGRWSQDQILEEHQFLFDLQADDISVITPFKIDGKSLFLDEKTNLSYCLFPKRGGRIPQEMTDEQLEVTGRMLARLHNTGSTKPAEHRLRIHPESFGRQNLQWLLDNKIIPPHLEESYKSRVYEICDLSEKLFEGQESIRIHGDCHWGNMILRDEELYFIDFDDMLMGPPVQDIWLVVPGTDQESIIRRNLLLEAYESMRHFRRDSLKLIEPLRALRYIHFTAWIARRWEDPSFQNAFPHFSENNYWDIQINDLNTQLIAIRNLNQPEFY